MLSITTVSLTPSMVETGKAFLISLSITEMDAFWEEIKNEMENWDVLKSSYSTWKQVKQS